MPKLRVWHQYNHEYKGKSEELNDIHEVLEYPKYLDFKKNIWLKYNTNKFEVLNFQEGEVPDVKGMTAMDAIYLLENLGLDVELYGKGKVIRQSLKAGDKISENKKIQLNLSS